MFNKVMVPVDLAHSDKLDKAIGTAVDLAKMYRIPICFVGVTVKTPTEVARTPKEFEEKLAAFGVAKAEQYGCSVLTKTYLSHDPAANLNEVLISAAGEIGADLIVMASHVPGLAEHIFASHAGAVASHSVSSVLVVR